MPDPHRKSIAVTAVTWGALIVFVGGAILAVSGYLVTDAFEIFIAGMSFNGGNVGLAVCALSALLLSQIIGRMESVEPFGDHRRPAIAQLSRRGPGPWIAAAIVCVVLLLVRSFI